MIARMDECVCWVLQFNSLYFSFFMTESREEKLPGINDCWRWSLCVASKGLFRVIIKREE